jgi:hypothetical protein
MNYHLGHFVHEAEACGWTGEEMYLNRDTPNGVFEACNGNKYIITTWQDLPTLIALGHRHLEPFTWDGLGKWPMEFGKWWGPYQLILTHSTTSKLEKPGIINVGESAVTMHCPDGEGGENWVDLSDIRPDADPGRFDGWSVQLHWGFGIFFSRLVTNTKQELNWAVAANAGAASRA